MLGCSWWANTGPACKAVTGPPVLSYSVALSLPPVSFTPRAALERELTFCIEYGWGPPLGPGWQAGCGGPLPSVLLGRATSPLYSTPCRTEGGSVPSGIFRPPFQTFISGPNHGPHVRHGEGILFCLAKTFICLFL